MKQSLRSSYISLCGVTDPRKSGIPDLEEDRGEKHHGIGKIESTKIAERQPSQNPTWALLEFTVQSWEAFEFPGVQVYWKNMLSDLFQLFLVIKIVTNIL